MQAIEGFIRWKNALMERCTRWSKKWSRNEAKIKKGE